MGEFWESGRVADSARVYDALLGGKDNFAVDREVAGRVLEVEPLAGVAARDNRFFVLRAVRYVAGAGVSQFIDVGAGFPVAGANVHEAAGSVDPDSRVVYVDRNATVVAHANALLCGDDSRVGAVLADMLEPRAVLDASVTRRLIDLSRPVCLVLGAMLHFVPDSADPWGLVGEYVFDLAPGSFVVISHGTADARVSARRVTQVYEANAALAARSFSQVSAFFAGLELVEPGVAWAHEWRPGRPLVELAADPTWERRRLVYGGVGRKPAHGGTR